MAHKGDTFFQTKYIYRAAALCPISSYSIRHSIEESNRVIMLGYAMVSAIFLFALAVPRSHWGQQMLTQQQTNNVCVRAQSMPNAGKCICSPNLPDISFVWFIDRHSVDHLSSFNFMTEWVWFYVPHIISMNASTENEMSKIEFSAIPFDRIKNGMQFGN